MLSLIVISLCAVILMCLCMTVLAIKLLFYKLSVVLTDLDIQPIDLTVRRDVVKSHITARPIVRQLPTASNKGSVQPMVQVKL